MAKQTLLDDLMGGVRWLGGRLPVWATVALAMGIGALVFLGVRKLGETMLGMLPGPVHGGFVWFAAGLGVLAAVLVLIAGVAGARDRKRRTAMLRATRTLDQLKARSWREFETLVAEAYRRRGHKVRLYGGARPDGGVDVVVEAPDGGERKAVQCKHYQQAKIGVKVVRELNGVVRSDGYSGGVIVGCGEFTKEAVAYAQRAGIELVGGRGVLDLLDGVADETSLTDGREPEAGVASAEETPAGAGPGGGCAAAEAGENRPPASEAEERWKPAHVGREATAAEVPTEGDSCPKCGARLVERVARRGAKAGRRFLGCSRYPECREVVALE